MTRPYSQAWDCCPKSRRTKIKPDEKTHIRCLFIYRLTDLNSKYIIGLLTDNYEFFYCEIYTKYVDLTTDLWLKMRRAYKKFKFSKTTDVMYSGDISVYEPLIYYHKILQEQIFFNMRSVDPIRVLRRIETYHPYYVKNRAKSKNSTRMCDIPILWEKIRLKKKCPWIDDAADAAISQLKKPDLKRHMFIRLALYYILIKQHLYIVYKNSYSYRKRHNRLTVEEQALEKSSSSIVLSILKETIT